jgi:hypothetical protein
VRWLMQERRTAERIRLDLKARWEGLMTQGRGAVCDLSSTGCFVLSGGAVRVGEFVKLEIHFPKEVSSLWGEVVYTVSEIGFALKFTFSGEQEQRSLEGMMATVEL